MRHQSYVLLCSKMTSFPPSEGVTEITFGSICSRSLCLIHGFGKNFLRLRLLSRCIIQIESCVQTIMMYNCAGKVLITTEIKVAKFQQVFSIWFQIQKEIKNHWLLTFHVWFICKWKVTFLHILKMGKNSKILSAI